MKLKIKITLYVIWNSHIENKNKDRWECIAYKGGVLREFTENGIVYVAEPTITIGHKEGLEQYCQQNKVLYFAFIILRV